MPHPHASSICLLDDSAWVFDLYRTPLQDVLGREVHPLLHEGQDTGELVRAVLELAPGVLLLDGQLQGGREGPDVLREILRHRPALTAIGFSSDTGYAPAFRAAGAAGFVHKGREDPLSVAREVAALLRRLP